MGFHPMICVLVRDKVSLCLSLSLSVSMSVWPSLCLPLCLSLFPPYEKGTQEESCHQRPTGGHHDVDL